MRRSISVLALTAIAALVLATPAHAGIIRALAMNLSPTSGIPGSAVTLSSSDPCPAATGAYNVSVLVADQPNLVNGPFLGPVTLAPNGTWSFPTTIAANAAVGSSVTFYAECQATPTLAVAGANGPNAQAGSFTLAPYTPVSFAVVAPPTTTTTTASTTTTAPATTTTTAPLALSMTAVPDFMYPLESCELRAKGFAPGTGVEITVYSAPLVIGTVVANSTGEVSTVWQVPAGFEAGLHTVVMRGTNSLGAAVEVSATVTVGSLVQAQPVPPPAPTQPVRTLPTTGSGLTIPLLLGSAVLLAGGAASIAVARRRTLG